VLTDLLTEAQTWSPWRR